MAAMRGSSAGASDLLVSDTIWPDDPSDRQAGFTSESASVDLPKLGSSIEAVRPGKFFNVTSLGQLSALPLICNCSRRSKPNCPTVEVPVYRAGEWAGKPAKALPRFPVPRLDDGATPQRRKCRA